MQRFPSTGLLFALGLLILPASADPLAWRTFTSSEAGFRVDLPGEPVYAFSEDRSLLGTVAHHAFVVEHPQARFDVERHALPALATFILSSKRLLDRARDDLLIDLDGALRGEEDITLQGYPGRRLWVQRAGVRHIEETRMLLAGRNLYIASVEAYRTTEATVTHRFFTTLRICPDSPTSC